MNTNTLPSVHCLVATICFFQILNWQVGAMNLYVAGYISTPWTTHRNSILTVFPRPVLGLQYLRTSQIWLQCIFLMITPLGRKETKNYWVVRGVKTACKKKAPSRQVKIVHREVTSGILKKNKTLTKTNEAFIFQSRSLYVVSLQYFIRSLRNRVWND